MAGQQAEDADTRSLWFNPRAALHLRPPHSRLRPGRQPSTHPEPAANPDRALQPAFVIACRLVRRRLFTPSPPVPGQPAEMSRSGLDLAR